MEVQARGRPLGSFQDTLKSDTSRRDLYRVGQSLVLLALKKQLKDNILLCHKAKLHEGRHENSFSLQLLRCSRRYIQAVSRSVKHGILVRKLRVVASAAE